MLCDKNLRLAQRDRRGRLELLARLRCKARLTKHELSLGIPLDLLSNEPRERQQGVEFRNDYARMLPNNETP